MEHELLGLGHRAELFEEELFLEIDVGEGVQDRAFHERRNLAGVVYPQNPLNNFLRDVPVDF